MRLALLLFAAFAAWNDAQRPDGRRIKYMVDYWSDMTTLAHEKWAAYGTADYIAGRLQATGMRRPEEFRGYMKGSAIAYLARERDKGGRPGYQEGDPHAPKPPRAGGA